MSTGVNKSLPLRSGVLLSVNPDRRTSMLRSLESWLNQLNDEVNRIKATIAQMTDPETPQTILAPHSDQHKSGGSDELYFSTLERSAGDSTLHDAYRAGPHVTQGEHNILAGSANHVFLAGFYPVVTVDKLGTPTQVALVPKWNTTGAGYWMVTPTEVP